LTTDDASAVTGMTFTEDGQLFFALEDVGLYSVKVTSFKNPKLVDMVTNVGTTYTRASDGEGGYTCTYGDDTYDEGSLVAPVRGVASYVRSVSKVIFAASDGGNEIQVYAVDGKDAASLGTIDLDESVDSFGNIGVFGGSYGDFTSGYIAIPNVIDASLNSTSLAVVDLGDLIVDFDSCLESSWTYEDQKDWDLIYPQCGLDNIQSPIDIDQSSRDLYTYRKGKYLPDLEIDETEDSASDVTLFNNGRFLEISGMNGNKLSGGGLFNDYYLDRAYIHWGSSEHTLNDKKYEGEIQFMFNKDTSSNANAFGTPTVGIAVLLSKGGKDKKSLAKIADAVKNDEVSNPDDSTTLSDFDWTDVLDKKAFKDFYTYQGLSTFPPCDESVTWFVGRYKNSMSNKQWKFFSKNLINDDGDKMKDAYRKTEDLGSRVVFNSYSTSLVKKNKDDDEDEGSLLEQYLAQQGSY